MNWQHLKLILWLRWRLSYNQWRRAGKINAVLTMMIVVSAFVLGFLAFFIALIAGVFTLSKAGPDHMMLIWDGIIVLFLFLWSIGVVTELQRSEFLSLDKMLHYPISPTGAFLLNYLSSLVSMATIMFLPAMLGLSIASVVTHGPAMLSLFPLVIGFILVVSALTYQFRGWMASLMENKRRRRTIISVVTVLFILMTQLPNLANVAFQRTRRQTRNAVSDARAELTNQFTKGDIEREEYEERKTVLEEKAAVDRQAARDQRFQTVVDNVALVNLAVPMGWLPTGARAATAGNVLPGLLGALGMTLLGLASLWRSHRATMRFYTGQGQASKPRRVVKAERPPVKAAPFLEKTIIGCSEQVSVVALAGFRNLIRAPEAKMALLTPIIMAGVFGSMMFIGPGRSMPVVARPFLALGGIAMTIFGMGQLTINLFGSDRGGFRAFVLMPIQRRDLLIGKNLSMAPLVAIMATLILVAVQIVVPLKMLHLVATLILFVPVYLVNCLIGNLTSIFAPVTVAAGSLKPVQPKFLPMMIQMFAMMTMPLALVPAAAALGIETLLDQFTELRGIPLYFLATLVELPLAVFLYRFLIAKQGRLLQDREAKILEVVSAHNE